MFQPDQYKLLDFGDGRKLERFGAVVLDRPAPAAELVSPADPQLWKRAGARYLRRGEHGFWKCTFPLPGTWCVAHGKLVLELKATDFGHVGLFPEQAANWDWIMARLREADPPAASSRVKVLNLFAYTGGATLAAAAADAEVVHVDAAQNVVTWARQNAALSGLGEAPIRWIVEDAEKFVRRELKRGNQYDAVVLDPPSYGHGPRGEPWKISDSLLSLLEMCLELTSGRRRFLLLSCHATAWGPRELERLWNVVDDGEEGTCVAQTLEIEAADGRKLPAGCSLRWRRRL